MGVYLVSLLISNCLTTGTLAIITQKYTEKATQIEIAITLKFLCAVPDSSALTGQLTDLHDPSKHRCVVHRAAVPPPLSELVLALLDASLGSVSDVDHVVLVQLAELPLALQTAQQQQQKERLAEISQLMV